MRWCNLLAGVVVIAVAGCTVWAQEPIVKNPSFEEGDAGPTGWVLSEEPGTWEAVGHTGSRCVSVGGEESAEANSWRQDNIPVLPSTVYRFSFFARTAAETTGGCIVSGPDFCNNDTNVDQEWAQRSRVFITKPGRQSMSMRFGQWRKTGKVFFDDVTVRPTLAVHRTVGGLTLGEGEKTEGAAYAFAAPLAAEGSNYSRPLVDFTAAFNTNRWVFGPGNYVTYRHEIAGAQQTRASVSVRVGYYASGHCIVEASADGEEFVQIGRIGATETADCEVPAALLPAEAIYIRLRSPGEVEPREDSHPGSFQVGGYEYSAQLGQAVPDLVGSTRYLDIQQRDPRVVVAIDDLGSLMPGKGNVAKLRLRNTSDESVTVIASLGLAPYSMGKPGAPVEFSRNVTIPAGAEAPVSITYVVEGAGDYKAALAVATGDETLFATTTGFTVPSLYASGYGYPVASDDSCDLWWCEGTYKVSRERPPVIAEGNGVQPIRIAAARNEFEPAQLVLRPKAAIKSLTAQASDLVGPGNAKIDAENLDLCYVWYHHVQRATDQAGCVGWWPDALPPLDEPIDLEAGQNQPLWLTVKVPKGSSPGQYKGTISLQADGWSRQVPVELRVWNFTLPDAPSVEAGFGLGPGSIWQYQNIAGAADREKVWDLYMQNFRDHRLAPYSFWLKGIDVRYTGFEWTGGKVVEENPFDGKYCMKIVDDSEDSAAQASTADKFDVDGAAPYVLSFAAKTGEPGQKYLVTLQSYDAGGSWISGHNVDVLFTGNGEWTHETLEFVPAKRSPDARSLLLVLRPVPWSESGAGTGTAWFDDISLSKKGSEINLVSDGDFEAGVEAVHAEVDFSNWDPYAEKYLDDYGFSAFRLPLSGMGGGTFHSRHYGRIGPYEQGTPEYRRVFKEYCSQLQEHLAEKGWLDKAYIYWFDEPAPDDFDFVKEGMAEIKRAGPRLRRMLTEEPGKELFDAVDIWCPVLSNHDADMCRERQEAGDTIWWYVCTGPKAPYPGLFIDHDAVDLRVWLWMTWKWNVSGVLVWQTNYWTSYCAYPDEPQNPWEDPMGYVSGYGLPKGHVAYWGNGDGRFLYPPNKDVNADKTPYISGPVNSIRWEMLREGLEDFEYFDVLKQLTQARPNAPERALLEVPQDIVLSKTEYSKDPQLMYRHREQLARAIERLGGN